METPDAQRAWALPEPYDFFATTRLLRTGHRDPTVRREADGLWRTAHTPEGPATVRLLLRSEEVQALTWGPGAECVLEDVPLWLGLQQPPWSLPSHPVTDRLLHEHRGLRSCDTRDVFEGLVNVILQQLVTWNEAATTWRRLCTSFGEPAPGPGDLRLSPTAKALRAAGSDQLQARGMRLKQAKTVLEAARVQHALQPVADMPTPQALQRLQAVRGIGPWSAAYLLGMRLARPEPVLLGDYHLPSTVAWALAGEERASEARMVELLKPFAGHAFQVVLLIYAAGIQAPRRGPKRGWGR